VSRRKLAVGRVVAVALAAGIGVLVAAVAGRPLGADVCAVLEINGAPQCGYVLSSCVFSLFFRYAARFCYRRLRWYDRHTLRGHSA